MSCWTTLGPFQRPTGNPIIAQNSTKMDLYGPKWPFMTLNDASMKSFHDPKCPFMSQNIPAYPK